MIEKRNKAQFTYEDFVGHLRSALHYLYDPVHLRRSPLVEIFNLAQNFDTASSLQRCITDAIHALEPADHIPPLSSAWRIYDLLNLQYLRQSSRDEVAVQLGISERQLRREQRLALEALAQFLWQRVDSERLSQLHPFSPAAETKTVRDVATLDENLSWLSEDGSDQLIPLEESIKAVKELAQPLAGRWKVEIQMDIQTELTGVPVPGQVFRNILLTLLSIFIPHSSQEQVLIRTVRSGEKILIEVKSQITASTPLLNEKECASLVTAQHLATYMNATMTEPISDAPLAITIILDMPVQIPILVIDDNNDWLDLLKRYCAGSRYRVVGLREANNARALAEKLQPAVIFLDVMMPNTDGWAILNDLRQEPATSQIPIVISTILPLEGLAISLGANGFLQKPITQVQFLNELSRLIDQTRVSGA